LRGCHRDNDSRRHLALAASRETEARVTDWTYSPWFFPFLFLAVIAAVGAVLVTSMVVLILEDIVLDWCERRHRR
jgi:hypothetical protein